MKRLAFILICSLIVSVLLVDSSPGIQRFGILDTVKAIPPRAEWNRFKILVWQYRTSVLEDLPLYRQLGMGGFHIDRGYGKDELVALSNKGHFPYYVDHAASKGFLYLKGDDIAAVTRKRGLVRRPHSLADARTIEKIRQHLIRNIGTTKTGLVLAYSFDDEISLGHLSAPCDVDIHPDSLAWFREWLKQEYAIIEHLNKQWGTNYKYFTEVMPQGFEELRKKIRKIPLSSWNLSPWIDFRHFMDFQLAAVLAELCRYANAIDPQTPAGFAGGQGPGPWGGYDYAMLSRVVQWMEAYDIHGTNEILRSFWNRDRRPRMQTFFSTKNPKLDSWFLWYYLLHGNQAVIAWPDGWFRAKGYDISPFILENKDTFEEIQGPISEPIVSPHTVFDPDPIGIYYSHPSIQAGWAMDALAHGSTWINRLGSIDEENQSKGVLRKVWCKILEDLGFQYDFVSYLDVQEGAIDLSDRFKVIILPKTICLSDQEADALRTFVKGGGTLIADYLCGVLDKHGKGRSKGVLDELFGVTRNDADGYMNGEGLTEIDGEKYEKPFLERLTYYNGAYRYKGIVVFERGTRHPPPARGIGVKGFRGALPGPSVLIKNREGNGTAIYLNLTAIEYWAPHKRFSSYGHEWRTLLGEILQDVGLQPRVRVYESGCTANMIECLYWKNGERRFLGLVKNPTEHKERGSLGNLCAVQGITGNECEIRLEFRDSVSLVNLRTHKHSGCGEVFHDRFKPWQGNLYEYEILKEPGLKVHEK